MKATYLLLATYCLCIIGLLNVVTEWGAKPAGLILPAAFYVSQTLSSKDLKRLFPNWMHFQKEQTT